MKKYENSTPRWEEKFAQVFEEMRKVYMSEAIKRGIALAKKRKNEAKNN